MLSTQPRSRCSDSLPEAASHTIPSRSITRSDAALSAKALAIEPAYAELLEAEAHQLRRRLGDVPLPWWSGDRHHPISAWASFPWSATSACAHPSSTWR